MTMDDCHESPESVTVRMLDRVSDVDGTVVIDAKY
jgi:hypothetical protein